MQRYSFLDIQALIAQWYRNPDGSPARVTIQPYGYNVTVTSIAQNATSTQQLQITANADFIWLAARYRASIAAAAQTISTKTAAFVRVLITDSGTNQQAMNSAVDLENYSTNGGYARDLPYPRLLQGRTSLTLAFTNYSGGGGETYAPLDFFLEGVQVQLL